MSLGNVLLQPQRLQRVSADADVALVQDVLRLVALLAEDAAAEGPLAAALPQVIARVGARMQAQAGRNAARAFGTLKTRFQPLFLYFEKLVRDVESVDQTPTALLSVMRGLIAGMRALLDATSQAQIKAGLDFAKELVQQVLGIDRAFVSREIAALFDDVVAVWQTLPADISPVRRRRKRLAIQAVRRVQRRLLNRFELPDIDTAPAAARIYGLLRSSGLKKLFEEIDCVLDKFDEAAGAAQDIGAAVSVGGGSVGAALIQPPGSARYCWYASWVLSDIDLPLLGIGDIENKRDFALAIRFRNHADKRVATVSKYVFSTLTIDQQRKVMEYTGGPEQPSGDLMRLLVGQLNMLIQKGPIYTSERFNTPHADQSPQDLNRVPFEFRLRTDEAFSLPDALRDAPFNYVEKQELFLFNRRFLGWAFGEQLLSSLTGGFWRYVGRKTVGSKRDVYVSGDRRFLMCDDMPIYLVPEGTELKWEEAPLFYDKDTSRQPAEGATYYHFLRVPALACEILAQVLYGLEQTGRPIWHLVDLQPGHEIGTGIVSGLDILHALNELLFGKPISGYESLGGWGKWLANDLYGPRGLALLGGSFQGRHTAATGGNIWWFWVTVVLGDFIRIYGHNSILQAARDFVLTFFTLLNSSESNSGDSSLPKQPAANRLKQAGVTGPMNTLFAYLLMLNYKRQNHSVEIWSAGNIGDRREHAFGLWFGGCAGFGVLGGLSGGILSQIIAWKEDFKLLGITIGESAAYLFLLYWFLEYFFKEGDTADGTYALTGSYKGYPRTQHVAVPLADGGRHRAVHGTGQQRPVQPQRHQQHRQQLADLFVRPRLRSSRSRARDARRRRVVIHSRETPTTTIRARTRS